MIRFLSIALLLLLAACGGTAEPPAAPVAEASLSPLQIILTSADFAVGEPRISFAIFDGTEVATDVSKFEGTPLASATAPEYLAGNACFWRRSGAQRVADRRDTR